MRLPYPITPSRLTVVQSPFQARQGYAANDVALRHREQDHEGGRGEHRGGEDVVPVVVVDLLLVEGNADRDRVLGPVVEHDERPQEVVPLSDEQEASGAVMLASLKMSSSRLTPREEDRFQWPPAAMAPTDMVKTTHDCTIVTSFV